MDAFSGFSIVRESKYFFVTIGTLLALGIIYVVAESVGSSINEIDDIKQPLWRRAFNLLVLLLTTGLFILIFYYVFKFT